MENDSFASRRAWKHQRRRKKEWDWTERQLSTSAITALLILGAEEDWSPNSYLRASKALEYIDPIGSLLFQEIAERKARLM